MQPLIYVDQAPVEGHMSTNIWEHNLISKNTFKRGDTGLDALGDYDQNIFVWKLQTLKELIIIVFTIRAGHRIPNSVDGIEYAQAQG